MSTGLSATTTQCTAKMSTPIASLTSHERQQNHGYPKLPGDVENVIGFPSRSIDVVDASETSKQQQPCETRQKAKAGKLSRRSRHEA